MRPQVWAQTESIKELIWAVGSLVLYNPGLRIAVVAENPRFVMQAIEKDLSDVCIVKRFGASARVTGAKRTIRVLQRYELEVTEETFNFFMYHGKKTDLHWRCLDLRIKHLRWKNNELVNRARERLFKSSPCIRSSKLRTR